MVRHIDPKAALLALVLAGPALPAGACTFFKVTRNGYTMVGNNEDAWSINARIRFENGGPGEYGAVYVGHYNGSPVRVLLDQGGMNEVGLMFDGLGVPFKPMPRDEGRPLGDLGAILRQAMRTCSTVQQAAALFSRYDMSLIAHAVIVLVDRSGAYLVVEGDTLLTGNDATYVLGNFRPSACTDLDAVPIPRFQKGRALIAQGVDTSLAWCTAVMDSMRACRAKLGEGTLYMDILDPERGLMHLYFYHDFSEVRTFDLKAELAKGDHSVDMASLFGERPEYEALLAYVTPFHQRWLFWGLAGTALLAALAVCYGVAALVRRMVARSRHGRTAPLLSLLALALTGLFLIGLIGTLLFNEGVYYFGLSDVGPLFAWLPLAILVSALPLFRLAWAGRKRASATGPLVFFARSVTLSVLLVVGLAMYWGLLIP